MNLLINPTKMTAFGQTPPPLGLLYLASMAETTVYDAALLKEPVYLFLKKHRPKIVGVSMYTSVRQEALQILRAAKELGAKTVAGGPHVGTCWKQLKSEYPFIDHLVIGDGELAWRSLCRGESLPQNIRMPVENLDTLPLPAWESIDLSPYPAHGTENHNGNDLTKLPRVSIVLGRGCNGSCTYCSTWWVNGKYRAHGSQWMHRQLDCLWRLGVRHLVFQDDCLTADKSAAMELCRVLQLYSFSWSGTTRADSIDDELAEMMVRAGCYELNFGVETGSMRVMKLMNKKIKFDDVFNARQICLNHGIKFIALMMFGYPYETDLDRAETHAFLDKLNPDSWSSYDETFILPGTALYAACKRKKLVDDDYWLGNSPFFYLDGLKLVKNCQTVTNLASIKHWGPEKTTKLTPFNVQSDGNSAFWIEFEAPIASYQHIMINNIVLPTVRSGSLATASFHHEKLLKLIERECSYEVHIFDGLHHTKQLIGYFSII